MSRDQILTRIETLISAVHESVHRLKSAEPNNTPAIEVALLESKLVTFFDEVQTLKLIIAKKQSETDTPIAEIEKTPEPIVTSESRAKDEIVDIKNQFESLKAQLEQSQKPEPTSIRFEKSEKVEDEQIDSEIEELIEIAAKELEIEEQSADDEKAVKPKENNTRAAFEKTVLQEIISEDKEVKKTAQLKPKSVTKPEIKQPETEKPKAETKQAPEKQEPIIEKSISQPISETKAATEKPESLNDRLRNAQTKTSLYDKLNSNRKSDTASRQLTGKPIKDLKKAINLNQQIRFQKELFDNDKRALRRTIDFVNKCNTFSEARSYLQHEVGPQFKNWDETNINYSEFMDLVKRRFM